MFFINLGVPSQGKTVTFEEADTFEIALAHYALMVGKRRQLALKVQQTLDVSEQSRFCLLLARAALAWADEQVDAAHAVLVAEGSK